ncbi:MAG: type II toxin-antitoxin system VapC family toxin [Verrucomicrobia bacterium]|nr:type II toxin-antitoxin system VapC family toxin [Verrucomicrobiota bacterium]
MQLLIDSHILIWSVLESQRLKPRERDALMDSNNTLFFSVVSLAELYHKESHRRITLPREFPAAISALGFTPLALTPTHAEHLRTLPLIHSDPFDRILAAQAISENLVLMTRDRILKKYPITIF